jgi:SAM-dependent methyltransferase
MGADRPSGTEGYAEAAAVLEPLYEGIAFADLHRPVLHLMPPPPSLVLDIGAGTGRDAAALAALGHQVTAVEPTAALRLGAIARHPSPRIAWLDDSLPELARLAGREGGFDLAMLTAVWMHLDEAQRRQAMPRVARLVRAAGVMIFSLRHGPVPSGRRMFEVSADETVALAAAEGMRLLLRLDRCDGLLPSPGVSWTRLAFSKEPTQTPRG